MVSRAPNLPLVKPILSNAKNELNNELGRHLGRVVEYRSFSVFLDEDGGVGKCRDGNGNWVGGVAMVNDGCPVLSALSCVLGGRVIRHVRVVDGELRGGGARDVQSLVLGKIVHREYTALVQSLNPGWAIQVETHFKTVVERNGVEFTVKFTPDILMGWGGEWHIVELKIGRPRPTHLLQLALYWHFLRGLYQIVRAWLVTPYGIYPVTPSELGSLVPRGLDYIVAVMRIYEKITQRDLEVIKNCECMSKLIKYCRALKKLPIP